METQTYPFLLETWTLTVSFETWMLTVLVMTLTVTVVYAWLGIGIWRAASSVFVEMVNLRDFSVVSTLF